MGEPAVVARQLGKKLGMSWVLRGLDMEVPHGCVYGLVGRNASGKSTMLNLLAGLLAADEGSCLIHGHDPSARRRETASHITYVDQAKTMYGHLTVGQMIGFMRGLSPNWSAAIAAKYIRVPAETRVRALSKEGRVQLAYGLAAARRTPILMIDEPTTNLDPVAVQQILRSLIQDCVSEGSTVLIASHELEEMSQVCERIGVLHGGKLCHEFLLEDIVSNCGVITALQPLVEVAGIADILRARPLQGSVRYLVKKNCREVAAELATRGVKILDVQSVTLRSLYVELLEDLPLNVAASPIEQGA
ncbi:MAG TPA: ABC transporter ATP-binding protein [Terracidiphilus sp.]|nr:ABC transporter ATP-binding protein [Terracidiphilus sp.]